MNTFRSVLAAVAIGLAFAPVRATGPAPSDSRAPSDESVPSAEPTVLKRGPGYPGALFLYQLEELTIVYPAGPGQDTATHKRSAEARARFLQSVHGLNARVVADVEVTEADRRGHLLVLGWGNAIFDRGKVSRPFEWRADAIRLLGEPVGEPRDDLLIFNRSPFAPDRYLVFWSRIDPERDRFMVLPRVGSDWAVMRDYRPVAQGMFVPGGAWPPVRDAEAQADHEARLMEIESRYESFASERFIVHYEVDRVPKAELEAIVKARERAYATAVAALGEPRAPFRIGLWVHEDEKAKKNLTGVDGVVHTIGREREIHTTRRAARAASAREETHVVARARIGPAFSTPLYEGLGIAVDGSWRGRDLDLEAAVLTDAGSLPPLADLLDEERFRQLDDGPAPPAAGLFVTWLRATQGAPAFAAIYGLAEASPAAVARLLGKSSANLETEFRGWVAERGARRAKDLIVVKAEAEARERLAESDYEGVAAALERARAAKPQDPQILFNLASALMRTPRLDDAEASFRKVLTLPLGPGDSRFRIFSLYQIGRILDIKGRRKEALAAYEEILALDDEFDAHRLARERIASPATREQIE